MESGRVPPHRRWRSPGRGQARSSRGARPWDAHRDRCVRSSAHRFSSPLPRRAVTRHPRSRLAPRGRGRSRSERGAEPRRASEPSGRRVLASLGNLSSGPIVLENRGARKRPGPPQPPRRRGRSRSGFPCANGPVEEQAQRPAGRRATAHSRGLARTIATAIAADHAPGRAARARGGRRPGRAAAGRAFGAAQHEERQGVRRRREQDPEDGEVEGLRKALEEEDQADRDHRLDDDRDGGRQVGVVDPRRPGRRNARRGPSRRRSAGRSGSAAFRVPSTETQHEGRHESPARLAEERPRRRFAGVARRRHLRPARARRGRRR